MAGNKDCTDSGHALHLCALKACGLNAEDNDSFAELVNRPLFVCENCGDKSNKAVNLCKPKKIQA